MPTSSSTTDPYNNSPTTQDPSRALPRMKITRRRRSLESMLDCKQSNIASGATPIGSADAHPTSTTRAADKNEGATPIGSAEAHPMMKQEDEPDCNFDASS